MVFKGTVARGRQSALPVQRVFLLSLCLVLAPPSGRRELCERFLFHLCDVTRQCIGASIHANQYLTIEDDN
jgi:hypothetical protein